MNDALTLPWQIQLSLAAGYATYMLAYRGIRSHHKPIDVAFLAIAFGLIATGALYLLPSDHPVFSAVAAFGVSMLAGLLWRAVGALWLGKALRYFDVSWANDDPSAWTSVTTQNSKIYLSQICVLTDRGEWLNCTDTSRFADEPFGPCVLGPTGDVSIYVTDEESADGTTSENAHVTNPEYGARMTYIPAGKVQRVAFRFKKRELPARRWWGLRRIRG
ncbi:hypothetical protein D3Y57_14395 [Sphingomonas paeninsulae]|uniref:Uncharacterized protein n=1 Tax=Sphingomonas paeninsulae TaxID=2319844 RepID=A0A494TIV4_SPHPE|nr:hypothetical protein [Sphingomonas paeninsulae]AYJ86913.1 hypothetical protein D3Y57_14395 [Sphingomonas paeninsulae]